MLNSDVSKFSLATAYTLVTIAAALTFTVVTTTEAAANSKCGGLNQRVCKKWEQLRGCDKGLHRTSPIGGTCTRDNKLIPDFIENKPIKIPKPPKFYEARLTHCGGNQQRVCKKHEQLRGCDPGFHRTSPVGGKCTRDNKLVPDVIEGKPIRFPKVPKFYEASLTHCGGLNQRVCKKHEQLRGCDPGLHRTSPVGGTCTPVNHLKIGSKLVHAANNINEGTAAQQRVLKSIATCIGSNRRQFKDAVKNRNMDAAKSFAFNCVTPQMAQTLQAAPTYGVRVASGQRAKFFHTLTIGVGGGAMYGVGGNGEGGIVLSLDGVTWPKFYSAGGVNVGVGAAAGADVIIGVSRDRLAAGRSQNLSVNASGKYVAGGGISVTFDYANPFQENPFNGISVSGGAGVGFEAGTVNPTWSRVY